LETAEVMRPLADMAIALAEIEQRTARQSPSVIT
jgi:hypothetical protein